jgi:hypothetical protein
MLARILACDWLAIVQGPNYDLPFPFYPNSYWIRTPSFIPLINQSRENLKHFIRLSVTKHLQSDTFRGKLDLEGVPFNGIKGEFAATVVVKYAGTEAAIEKLEYEYQVIQKLRSAAVNDIPKVIGLFFYQTVEENDDPQPMAVLVMEDPGKPVDGLDLSNQQMYVSHFCWVSRPLTTASRTAFVKALKSIHEGGFIHGNIIKDNLVMRNNIKLSEGDQGVVIIGLGNARALLKPSNDEVADEHRRLRRLLPNSLKHAESGNHTHSFVDVYPEVAVVESSDSSPDSDTPRPAKRRN